MKDTDIINEQNTAGQDTVSDIDMPVKENRMGTEPVHGLMIKMSLPLMVSMLVQSIYNIVDSIFVSMINEDALTAVSLCYPVQQLMIAFAVGTAVGMSALMSRYLGAKDFGRVTGIAQNAIFLSWCTYAAFAVIGFFSYDFIRFQTGDARIISYGGQYLRIVCWLSIMVFTQITIERMLQSTGKTVYIFITQATGAVINIIMDPILIFGLLGAPKLGVAGAAIATVFGQTVSALLGVYFNVTKNKEIHLTMKGFRPSGRDIKEIYIIGLPSIVMQSVGSVMVFGFNQILVKFTTSAVAAFGAYFKLQSFIFMPVFGLSNGVIPIIAYNYGARKKDRMLHTMSLSVRYSVTFMVIGAMLFWIIPDKLLGFFSATDAMLRIGVPALRIIAISFPLAGYSILRSSAFQALGKSTYGMYMAIVRQLGLLLPVGWLLSLAGRVELVWWAFPIAEVSGFVMAILFTRKIRREIIDRI